MFGTLGVKPHGFDFAPDEGQPTPGNSGEETRFSQADLDRIAGEARKDGRKKAITDFLTELGFEKPEDLKTLVETARKQKEAEMSEAEQERKRVADLEAKLQQMETLRQQERLASAVKTAVQAAHARKPEDVLDLMKVWGKLDGLLTDKGDPDDSKIKAAVDAFRKEAPEYFQTSTPGTPGLAGQGTPPNPDQKALDESVQEMRKCIRRF